MSKNELSVTVVIPTFNEEKYISDCLRALSRQSYKINRIIVVDNNSTDGTKKISEDHSNVEVLEEKRQHQVFARLKGFNAASTDLVATIDADTFVEVNWLDEMVRGLKRQHVDAISSYTIVRNVKVNKRVSLFTSASGFYANKIFSGHYGLYGSSLLIKRDTWESVRGGLHLDQSVWEDVDLAAACNKQGHKIGLVKKPLVTTSFRRSESTPRELYRYLHGWQKAFRYYNKVTASLIWVFSLFVIASVVTSRVFIKTLGNLKKIGTSVTGAVIR